MWVSAPQWTFFKWQVPSGELSVNYPVCLRRSKHIGIVPWYRFLGPILQMLKTESTKDRLCTKIGADNVRLVGRYPPKIVAAGSKTRGVCMCRGLLEKGPLKRALHSTNMLCQTASDLCHCINKIAWLFQPSKNFSVYTIGSRNKQGYKKQTRVLKVLLNGLVGNHLCVKVISVYTFSWYSNHWWYCFVFV